MSQFTPYSAMLGGCLIGLSAALLMFFNGRIAGISGILGGILKPQPGDIHWRLAFLAGLLSGPLLLQVFGYPLQSSVIEGRVPLWIMAGLLVGAGAKLANGCTSGHGVCGIARFSMRSILATLVFMSVAIVTVYIKRHLLA